MSGRRAVCVSVGESATLGMVHQATSNVLERLFQAGRAPMAALITVNGAGEGINALLELGEVHHGEMPPALRAWKPARGGAPATTMESGWLFAIDYEHASAFEPRARPRHGISRPTATWMRFARASGVHAAGRTQMREPGFGLGTLVSRTGRDGFERSVRTALEHIAAGDVYQINLTHQLRGRFEGSSRALFAALVRRAEPWFGAYVEMPASAGAPARMVLSASPEMFLTISPGGTIATRPMKGTRANAALADDLARSEKERAELTMIVDLMRNDLGRVCEAGSITVPSLRTIETHAAGTLLQATGTVCGVLRRDATLHDVLAATFPPGSITGAPKLRAMQIIDELEPVARGAYCGVIGYATDDGHAGMSVAIRTAVIEGEELLYGVGAGIVADSDPASEWQETLDKARIIMDLVEGG